MDIDPSTKGKLSVLKGVISEYIACHVLSIKYRNEIAKVIWHPKLDYYPRLNYYNVSVYIRDGVNGIPLPYVGMCSPPNIPNVFECIPRRVIVLDFNEIISLADISSLKYKEFLEILRRLAKYMCLGIFRSSNKTLKTTITLGQIISSSKADLLDLLKEIRFGENILLKIFEFLASRIDVDKLVERIISMGSLDPSHRDYMHKCMNRKNMPALLLYMLGYNKDLTLELLRKQMFHNISERITKHMNILSKLITCGGIDPQHGIHDIVVFLFDEFGLVGRVDVYDVKNSEKELKKYAKTIIEYKKYVSENKLRKFIDTKNCLGEHVRIYLMYVPPCITNNKLPSPQIVEITDKL